MRQPGATQRPSFRLKQRGRWAKIGLRRTKSGREEAEFEFLVRVFHDAGFGAFEAKAEFFIVENFS
jgi:hypothetical protein